MKYYKLDEQKNVVPATQEEYYQLHRDMDVRRVAMTHLGDSEVSTVFLALDHRFEGDGPPIVFETLVFGGPMDDSMDRYSTWDEAVAGHERMCARVRRATPVNDNAVAFTVAVEEIEDEWFVIVRIKGGPAPFSKEGPFPSRDVAQRARADLLEMIRSHRQ